MADPFVAEIRMVPVNFAPKGWAWCDGQLLPISQNTALFSLLGTTYGGNGKSNFALPDLQGRIPMNPRQGPGLSPHDLGETGGSETVTLQVSEIPMHGHPVNLTPQPGEISDPSQHTIARSTNGAVFRAGSANVNMSASSIGFAGGSQAHNNMQPYLTTYFCIALQGVFATPIADLYQQNHPRICTQPLLIFMEFKPSLMDITLRRINESDLPFLLDIYAGTRKAEMENVPDWSESMRAAFIRSQFEAQHHYYQKNYTGADFWVICWGNVIAGRLYLHENFQGRGMRIIDITLSESFRNRGLGTSILQDLMHLSSQMQRPLSIHVEAFNPAKNLYNRLGFQKISETNGVYHLMEWKHTI